MTRKPTRATIKDGRKFKKARHSLGMTQAQFAEWLDLNSMTPSEYERGNLKIPRALWMLVGFARRLGVKRKRPASKYRLG